MVFKFFGLRVAGEVGQKLSKVRKTFPRAHFEWRILEGNGLREWEGGKNRPELNSGFFSHEGHEGHEGEKRN